MDEFLIPYAIFDDGHLSRMGPYNFCTYSAMASASTQGPAHVTQQELARRLGISPRRVGQAIKWLCKNGYLLRYRDSTGRYKYSAVIDPDLLPVIQQPLAA